MYKVGYMTYHIAECKNFDELLKLLKENVLITSDGELNYTDCCMQIAQAFATKVVQFCTRTDGFRAKVAELLMANNYGQDFPGDILKYV
jgi:hypothetical protein